MFSKLCRCGKQTKNFVHDIGPFFIAQCCTDAGYNHLGQLTTETLKSGDLVSVTRVVQDFDGNVISQEDVTPKKKKRWNRGGNIDIKKD